MLRVNALEILIFTSWLLISSEHFQVINIFVKKLHSNLHTCIKNMTEENKKLWISFYIFSIRVHVKAKKFVFFLSKSWERYMAPHSIKTVFFFYSFTKWQKHFEETSLQFTMSPHPPHRGQDDGRQGRRPSSSRDHKTHYNTL